MNKFDSSIYDSHSNYVIEASAGTGKTYNIVKIVKKLVNELGNDINRILIVTYTEKAAGELKDRIRSVITDSNVDVDNAPIYTIHSFCKNIIKEFGLSANLPLNLNVIDEKEIYYFADRYIREGEILRDISLISKCLYDYGRKINIDNIKETLVEGAKKYYLDMNGNEDSDIISLEPEDFEKYLKIMNDINNAYSFSELCSINEEIDYYYSIVLGSFDELMRSFSEELIYCYQDGFDFNGRKYQSRLFKSASDIELEAFDFFNDIKKLLKISESKILASKYLKDFYLKWQIEKEKNKSQTFDDMIRYVREAILNDNIDLKFKIKEKFDYAIIDEFQDTNQKQFDIFSSIFINDPKKHIIVVGDPKQSIYSFQGADVNVYLEAVEAISANDGEKCFLTKNYRSTKEMVESCNKLFHYYNFNGTSFNDSEYLVKDEKNDCHEAKYNGNSIKAFWIATDKENKEIDENEFAIIAVQKIIDCCCKDENGKTKLQIKHKNKQFRDVSFKDFAVLVRTSSEIPPIERALKNAGIPYLRYKDKKLFLGKECADWICLLEALNTIDYTGYNRKILKKALFTSFFGASLEVLNSDYFNKDDMEEVVIINKWKQLLYERNWEYLIDNILMESKLSNNLKTLKEIQSFAIYKQIGNYCIEYLSKGKTITELVRNLRNISNNISDEVDEENGDIVEKSTNFDCVQIMTMHASKGLQFPVVIGVAGFKGQSNRGKAFCYHDNDSLSDKKLTFSKNENVNNEEIAEWKRLFYVGYTRAEFLLILPYYDEYGIDFKDKSIPKEGTKKHSEYLQKLDKAFLRNSIENLISNHKDAFDYITKDCSVSFEDLRKKTKEILGSKDIDNNLKVSQEKVIQNLIESGKDKNVKKHSYSSLSHESTNVHLTDNLDNKEGNINEGLSAFDKLAVPIESNYDETISPIELPCDYPKGAKLGTALHEVFEGLDFENYSEHLENRIKNRFSKQGINEKPEWIEATKEIVCNVLEGDLPIVHGSRNMTNTFKLKSIMFNEKLDEVEFNFNILNKKLKDYCNGFVDMIFRKGDYYSIVDWKSDRLNDDFDSYSNILSLKKHVDDCYSIQRVLYSYCLIKWLKISMPHLTEQEIFEKHFGGVYYIFLRGCNKDTGNGIYSQTWQSWKELLESYNKIINIKVGGISND